MSVSHMTLGASSTSQSLTDLARSGYIYRHESMKNVIILLLTFSTTVVNYDMFSRITDEVSIVYYVFFAIVLGLPYIYMDVFIKMYTGKNDLNEYLNPLLIAVNYGILMQTLSWSVLNISDSADVLIFLVTLIYPTPTWNDCQSEPLLSSDGNGTCISTLMVEKLCQDGIKILESNTSMHAYYYTVFVTFNQATSSRWIISFFVLWSSMFVACSVSEVMVAKIFKVIVWFGSVSTILLFFYTTYLQPTFTIDAIADMFSVPRSVSTEDIRDYIFHVSYAYNIGLVGYYDFSTVQKVTVIGNSIILFTIIFLVLALLRSIFIKTVLRYIPMCFEINEDDLHEHYIKFSLLPQCTMFLQNQRLVLMSVFAYLLFSSFANVTAFLYSSSKILQSKFRGVNNVYIVGIICLLGFLISVLLVSSEYRSKSFVFLGFDGVRMGVQYCQVFLGFMKVTIVMYLYGVTRFVTDVCFWLGEKPSKFWIFTWTLLPVFLFIFNVIAFLQLIGPSTVSSFSGTDDDFITDVVWRMWLITTFALVVFISFRITAKYVAANKLGAILKANKKYGPPEVEMRKKRITFDETSNKQECPHECMSLEDTFDCNHGIIINRRLKSDTSLTTVSSEMSMMRIFEGSRRSRVSELMDFSTTHLS